MQQSGLTKNSLFFRNCLIYNLIFLIQVHPPRYDRYDYQVPPTGTFWYPSGLVATVCICCLHLINVQHMENCCQFLCLKVKTLSVFLFKNVKLILSIFKF